MHYLKYNYFYESYSHIVVVLHDYQEQLESTLLLESIVHMNLNTIPLTEGINIFIIQHIATMSKYGHSALNISRAYSTDIVDIRNFVYRKEKIVVFSALGFVINVLNNKTIILLNLAEYRLILANSVGLRPRRLSIRRYSAQFRRIIVKYSTQ